MAITGIDTIDGKQIIAAGAVSAKSAEMAYNDENGNPITGYLTAVPEGYATTGDLTAYQTTAGMTAYQSAGDYLSANALDDVSGDWNRISALSGYSANGWSVSPTAGKEVFAKKVLFSPQAGQILTAYLGVYSPAPGANTASDVYTYIADGSIYLYNSHRSPSAQFIRPDTIVKWNNYASGKLNTTASANFYTTANESGFISEVPDSALSGFIPFSASGIELPNSNFKIDVSGQAYKVSSYSETETITGNYGGDYETWFPLSSLERRVYSSTLPPGDFDCGIFMVYPNHGGTEYFIPLNGIVDLTQIPQENWDTSTILSINAANQVEAILSYSDTNNVEIPYLTTVPVGTMNESAFEYDENDKISGYNGSAFAGDGGEFPQSATEAIETVTANSADWNETTETVSSNSGAWGGSALPISAGPGIKFEMVNNTLVASTDETLLFSGSNAYGYGTIPLSESLKNFKRIKVLATRAFIGDGNTDRYSGPWSEFECDGIANTTAAWGAVTPVTYEGPFWKFSTFTANSTFTELKWFEGGYIKVTNPSEYAAGTTWNDGKSCGIKAVIGINRK